jgi:hypothetical protein
LRMLMTGAIFSEDWCSVGAIILRLIELLII